MRPLPPLAAGAAPTAEPASPPLTSAVPAAEPATLQLTITGLRSSRGAVRICLLPAADFPNCNKGTDVRKLAVPAAATVSTRLAGLPPGDYAIAAIHDENDNHRLDRNLVGLPTEGVGFSRNPPLLFGPPRFAAARFHVAGSVAQTIRIAYFL